MNGNIMMGFGLALTAWGAVALLGYRRVAEGAPLLAAGLALLLIGKRQSRRGQ